MLMECFVVWFMLIDLWLCMLVNKVLFVVLVIGLFGVGLGFILWLFIDVVERFY